jgi:membrane-bound ClpP family serine protease
MEWITVISLIAVGLILVVTEIIFVPGTTVIGFIGFGVMVVGLILGFNYFDKTTGWVIAGGTAFASALLFYWAFRSKAWERFALKTSMKGKVNEGELDNLKVGEEGITVSALRPMGKAELGGKMVEVTSTGNYVESNTRIKVIRISSNQILVEPIK